MIEIIKVDERRTKVNTNSLKLLIIIIRTVVIKNIFRNSHHLLCLLHSKTH